MRLRIVDITTPQVMGHSSRTDFWNEATNMWNKLGTGFTYVFGSRKAAMEILTRFFPTATIEEEI
jgi:hypothetical protein